MHWIGAQFCVCGNLDSRDKFFEQVKILSERSKEMKEQQKNKESVLGMNSAYSSINAQFILVMFTLIS